MTVKLTEFTYALQQTDDFRRIVLNQTPLIDVRAPVEFNQGAFPSATNLPLMNDEERQKIGLHYKQHGNAAATKLGHQLVSEAVRAPRIQRWLDFIKQHPDAFLYCFRGGQRSKIAQQWIADQGVQITRLKGGYKAFRRFLIDYLDQVPQQLTARHIQPWVLGGRTGSGKTRVIQHLHHALDLEGIANHRGSAFGRHATPQPTQINFENQLAMAMMRLLENPTHAMSGLVIEDEARNIGSVDMPKTLFESLKAGQRVIIETPLETRVQITLEEYVVQAQQEYGQMDEWESFMLAAFKRIQKRLGGERYQRVLEQFQTAQTVQCNTGNPQGHEDWIRTLLVEYYDPMYDYQLRKNQRPIAFKGDAEAVTAFLNTQTVLDDTHGAV